MKNLLLHFLLTSNLFLACSQSPSSMGEGAASEEMNTVPTTEQSMSSEQSESTYEKDRMIIKTAEYRMRVKDVVKSTDRVKALLKTHNGYLANMNMTNNSYRIETEMTIRVPNENFEPLMNSLGDEAVETDYKRINASDVTEEFVDIESRLATKEEVRKRYIEVLRKKASTVDEILNAEEKIRVLTEEIEAKKGRLKYLRDQVSLSTIQLQIYERIPYEAVDDPEDSFVSRLGENFGNGWEMIVDLFLFLVNLWPFILIIIALVVFRKPIFKRTNNGPKNN